MSLKNSDFARSYDVAINGGSGKERGETDEPKAGVPGKQLLKWFADAYRGSETWRAKALEALRMISGDQWEKEVLAQLPPRMAPIVINMMLMPILYLSGVERQTRQEAKIVATSGANPRMAELMNELVHWVEAQNKSEDLDSQVFLDKIVTGMGWWKVLMNYDTDDLEGEIEVERRPPLAVFPDPNFLDAGWKHAQYVFDTQLLTIAEASARWPDHAEEFTTQGGEWLRIAYGDEGSSSVGATGEQAGDSMAAERLFWDKETQRVRIAEAWYKETTQRTVAVNIMDTEQVYMDEAEIDMIHEALAQNPALQQEWLIFKKPMTCVRVAHLFHDKKLDDDVTPCEENMHLFPLIPAMGFYFWGEPFGLVEIMKDLQREKNKRRSKLIELLGRMPLSGFLNKEGDGADQLQLENYGNGNGVVVNYKTTPPEQIQPPQLPMAVVHLEDAATKEMKEVTNVHDELLGQATQKTISGDAIEARQRGGFISHEKLFDSFRLEKQERVRFLIGMVKQYISPTKALRILGTLAQQGNQQLDQMMGAAIADPVAANDVLTLLSDSFNEEYDVVISSKPTEPSLTMQAWQTLSKLKEAGAEIPPKTLWEAAAKAGLLTEAQVQEILAWIQQQMPPPPGAVPAPAAAPPGLPVPAAPPPA